VIVVDVIADHVGQHIDVAAVVVERDRCLRLIAPNGNSSRPDPTRSVSTVRQEGFLCPTTPRQRIIVPEMADDSAMKILLDEARDALDTVYDSRGNVRDRSITVFSLTTVALGFLARADKHQGAGFWAATVFFVVAVLALIRIHFPKTWFRRCAYLPQEMPISDGPDAVRAKMLIDYRNEVERLRDRLQVEVAIPFIVMLVSEGAAFLCLLVNLAAQPTVGPAGGGI
jgi:hypothetical protein